MKLILALNTWCKYCIRETKLERNVETPVFAEIRNCFLEEDFFLEE